MIASKGCLKKISTLIVFVSLFLFSQFSVASSIKHLDINELLLGAELVFEGKVIAKKTRWNANKTDIVTDITFSVNDIVVGAFEEATLTLVFVGGTVDGSTVTIQGSEMPALNEQGVYFVESISKPLVNPLTGWAQGHFIIQADESGAMRVLTQNKMAVTGVQTQSLQKKSLQKGFLSKGVASGILVKKMSDSVSSAPMLADDFKAQLKAQMLTLKKKEL